MSRRREHHGPVTSPVADAPLKDAVRASHNSISDTVVALAQRIYENPELSDQEYLAADWCREVLDGAGFTVDGIAGVPTGFVAESIGQSEGPTIGLLAEYDALPGIGHGCGHHLIAGAAVGAGLALAGLKDLPGRIKVFGCPAEEILTGKPRMIDAGAFEGTDATLTFHAYHSSSVMLSCMGIRAFALTFHGQAAASADPWDGLNALDSVASTYQQINALPRSIRECVRIHGLETHGGDAFSVIPERATCHVAVRGTDLASLERTAASVLECAHRAAHQSGSHLVVEERQGVEPIRYNAPLGDAIRANLRDVGEEVVDWPALALTDFGNVSGALPGALFSVATWPASVMFHTQEAAEHSGKDKAFEAMLTGALVIALTAVDLVTDPDLLSSVRAAFSTPYATAPESLT